MQWGGWTMRTIMTALMMTVIVGSANAQAHEDATCKANQSGSILLTSVEYDNGYKVEAPWRVVSSTQPAHGAVRMTAVLDHIIETNPATGKRQLTALPGAIEMTFRGESSTHMLREAADVWCSTVAKALSARSADSPVRVAEKRVVM